MEGASRLAMPAKTLRGIRIKPASLFKSAEARRLGEVEEKIAFVAGAVERKITEDKEIHKLQMTVRWLGYESEAMSYFERARAFYAIHNLAIISSDVGPDLLDPVDAGLALSALALTSSQRSYSAAGFGDRARSATGLEAKTYYVLLMAALGDEKAYRLINFHLRMADEGVNYLGNQLAFVKSSRERLRLYHPGFEANAESEMTEGRKNSGATPWQGRT